MYSHEAALTMLVACVLGTGTEANQQQIEGWVYGAILSEYYDRAYVAAPMPPAQHVYFHGETIYVRIGVANRDGVPRRLDLGRRPLNDALEVTAITAPRDAGAVTLRPVGAGEVLAGPGERVADWQGVVDVPPSAQVHVFATVSARGSDIVRFEVRVPTTQAERAEVLRRQMERAELYQQDAVAERLADELLAAYPASASAHHVKAQVAMRRGRPEDATAALETALRLVRTKEDVLFVYNADPGVAHRAEQSLEGALKAARSGRRW